MLTPGTVKAGDELVYEFGNRVKQRKIVKVARITTEDEVTIASNGTMYRAGIIILENGIRSRPDGTPIGLSSYHAELHPLIDFVLKESDVDIDQYHFHVAVWYKQEQSLLHILVTTENQTKEFLERELETPITLRELPAPRVLGYNRDNVDGLAGTLSRLVREINEEEVSKGHPAILHR